MFREEIQRPQPSEALARLLNIKGHLPLEQTGDINVVVDIEQLTRESVYSRFPRNGMTFGSSAAVAAERSAIAIGASRRYLLEVRRLTLRSGTSQVVSLRWVSDQLVANIVFGATDNFPEIKPFQPEAIVAKLNSSMSYSGAIAVGGLTGTIIGSYQLTANVDRELTFQKGELVITGVDPFGVNDQGRYLLVHGGTDNTDINCLASVIEWPYLGQDA